MKKIKRIAFWGVIGFYAVVVIGYLVGENVAENAGLEYRSWVEIMFRVIVWFVPILMIGGMFFRICIKQWKKNHKCRWGWGVLAIAYVLFSAWLSFIYVIFGIFSLSTDKKMADGNLVVAGSEGLKSHYYYAEPVGFIFRREIVFDTERLADSLSKIYDLNFYAQKADNGDTVFVSAEYPDLEIKIIRYGYTDSTYLDTDLNYVLTSQLLNEHRKIFDTYDVELVPYVYGRTQDNEEGYGTCYGVLITEENQEDAAKAIAEFIQITMKDDIRTDGESCWSSVDGSIFLVAADTETGEIQSLRNIPFSLNPKHSWVLDKNVTNAEILEEIVNALK